MNIKTNDQAGLIDIFVRDQSGARAPIGHCPIRILAAGPAPRRTAKGAVAEPVECEPVVVEAGHTDPDGHYRSRLAAGPVHVEVDAFGFHLCAETIVKTDCTASLYFEVPVGFSVELLVPGSNCELMPCDRVRQGRSMYVRFAWSSKAGREVHTDVVASSGSVLAPHRDYETESRVVREYVFDNARVIGPVDFRATLRQNPEIAVDVRGFVDRDEQAITGDVTVTMRRAGTEATEDLALWIVIKKSTEALSFANYQRFTDHVLCGKPISPDFSAYEAGRIPDKVDRFKELQTQRFLPFTDTESYRILKAATEAFVMVNCGVALGTFPFDDDDLDYVVRRLGRSVDLGSLWGKYLSSVNGTEDVTLPYLALILQKLPDVRIKSAMFAGADFPEDCFGILRHKLVEPCLLELIWSYWQEEGMLAQTLNAVSRRFQNVRGASHDPLANLEMDPLRPLNNLMWGYIQDEQHRLSVVRRNHEYDHHYGLRLKGKVVNDIRAVDTRSKFLEAFHNLLHLCSTFFKQDDDTTIVADGFPLVNALKEVHLILSQGAHNQFGDLPSTSRVEMLMQQWLLARPEFREFLPTRVMVAYPEPWMDRVDAMKKLQGWSDTSVLHFRNLAIFGEQILLSIRFGAWSDVNDPSQGANWARFWRPEIQGYVHAYRAATGADLTTGRIDFTMPSVLLDSRLAQQQRSL